MAGRLRIGSALVLVAIGGLLASWASRPPRISAATARADCGVDRWTVKTLGDRPALIPSRQSTIKFLVSRPTPDWLPQSRLPFERQIFHVTAAVTWKIW